MKSKLMKGLIAVLVCTAMLAGCKKKPVGTPEDNAIKEETEEVEQESHIFGFSAINMENPYFITLESAISSALLEQEEPSTLITKDPAGDPDLQAQQLEEMVSEGVEAVFLSPVNWDAITPSLEMLKEAGVKIINVDTQVKEMDYVDAYVGSNNEEAGYICGTDLITRLPDGGNILILECPTQNSINERITGFETALASAEKGYVVVDRADTGGDFQISLDVTTQMLEKHPDISAIMCGNDQIAVGAKTAVNLAGNTDIIIYGVDGSPDIKKEIQKPDSQIAGTAAQSPINMGKTAVDIAFKVIKGEKFEKETFEEVFMINGSNLDLYGADGWQ